MRHQDPERRKAGGSLRRATHQVRVGDQHEDREGAPVPAGHAPRGKVIVAGPEAKALVRYLLSLKQAKGSRASHVIQLSDSPAPAGHPAPKTEVRVRWVVLLAPGTLHARASRQPTRRAGVPRVAGVTGAVNDSGGQVAGRRGYEYCVSITGGAGVR